MWFWLPYEKSTAAEPVQARSVAAMAAAVRTHADEVRRGEYPAATHTHVMPRPEIERLRSLVGDVQE